MDFAVGSVPEELAGLDSEDALHDELDLLEQELVWQSWLQRVPDVFHPLLEPHRYKGAYGGRGGAKSHFFAEALVRLCTRELGLRIVCIREVQLSLDQSVKRLLEDKIKEFGLEDQFQILKDRIITPGEGVIIFKGMQDHTSVSLKSLEGFDIAWVEEAQSLSQTSLDLLRPTMRKENSELWFSWNPVKPTDPVDAFFRGHEGTPGATPPPDSVSVRSSWEDNPYLPPKMLEEIEWDRQNDPEKYEHVWGGTYWSRSEAKVFKLWRIAAIERPTNAVPLHGGDWGFAADPTCAIACWINPANARELVVDHECWEVGCEIEDTPTLWDGLYCDGGCPGPTAAERATCQRPTHGLLRRHKVVGDSARPETISHMQKHGYPLLESAKKGANSVEEGIKFLQGYDIVVHPRCTHVIRELRLYSYKIDPKTGAVLPVLVDKDNHTIDSLRYAVEALRMEPKVEKVACALGRR